MRIDRLDLIRYGKFTDFSLAFPRADRDFHVIVGPNEAGKSTIRNAIRDLLFGMEMRSTYDFLHPKSELLLGAVIENRGDWLGDRLGDRLEFRRSKARKSLSTAGGQALPDNLLLPYLGTVDRKFFEQMYGLDHAQLVEGGNEILSASNDVGRVLFQSAAGIGHLGEVLDQLEREAKDLWDRRRAGNREYTKGEDLFKKAQSELKSLTVRAKEWSDAKEQLDELAEKLKAAQARHAALEMEKGRLERIRRVSPHLQMFRDKAQELAQMGTVPHLPDIAQSQINLAEIDIATGSAAAALHQKNAEAARQVLESIRVDKALLARASEIAALGDQRQQVINHERDILRQQEKIKACLAILREAAQELGWDLIEPGQIAARLPPLPLRKAIGRLAKEYPILFQAKQNAALAWEQRDAEATVLEDRLASSENKLVPPVLTAALSAFAELGNPVSLLENAKLAEAKTGEELRLAGLSLGQWQMEPESLRALLLPDEAEVADLTQRMASLMADKALEERHLRNAATDIAQKELEARQYRDLHHPVTLQDLKEARKARDHLWHEIRSHRVDLLDAAPGFEQKLKSADDIADSRHDNAAAAAELQTKLDEIEKLRQRQSASLANEQLLAGKICRLEAGWKERMDALGLGGMRLAELNAWRLLRDKVLDADTQHAQAHQFRIRLEEKISALQRDLAAAMRDARIPFDASWDIATLMQAATEAVNAAAAATARFAALNQQCSEALASRNAARKLLDAATADLAQWARNWSDRMKEAGFEPGMDAATMESMLQGFSRIDQLLKDIAEIQTQRIDSMQQELDGFHAAAKSLQQVLAPELAHLSAADVTAKLIERLAENARAVADAENYLGLAEKEEAAYRDAMKTMQQANARLQPYFEQSGTNTIADLRNAVQRSDLHRELSLALEASKKSVIAGGDGLPFFELEREAGAADPARLAARKAEIDREQEESLEEQRNLSAARSAALARLDQIGGQNAAANAEAMRQEALAHMGDAAERFIKVFVAARLLRWAIDRYRDTKHGPMLARASQLFDSLTLGSFGKLILDYDVEPPRLKGRRADGSIVGIEAMSDGTRDQLFMALRLSALDMYLDQASPLPFIADDLFVNYDDERSAAGFRALGEIARKTQVIFLTHHAHLVPRIHSALGPDVNAIHL